MFSLEEILRITGAPSWADWLERVAFNALPAQVDEGFTAKQYYQQTNQISCTRGWREFSTPHDGTDVLFGTLNGYPCCPKFTQNLWYSTPDGGLAALVYAPSAVTAKVAGGVEVTINETTDYPFRESIGFTIGFTKKCRSKASFPLRFRVPGWCSSAQVSINGEPVDAPVSGGIILLDRSWKRGDVVALTFPMQLQTVKFGVDYTPMLSFKFADEKDYVALSDMLDRDSEIYLINILDHAMDPMAESFITVRQLIQFVQNIQGLFGQSESID